MFPEKQLYNVRGRLSFAEAQVSGYEIHSGITTGEALESPFICFQDERRERHNDGAINHEQNVAGTYWHGLFEQGEALTAILAWAGLTSTPSIDFNEIREQQLERLADMVEAHLDMDAILSFLDQPSRDEIPAEVLKP